MSSIMRKVKVAESQEMVIEDISAANKEYGTLWEKTICKPDEPYLYSGFLCHDLFSETANDSQTIKDCLEEEMIHVTWTQEKSLLAGLDSQMPYCIE